MYVERDGEDDLGARRPAGAPRRTRARALCALNEARPPVAPARRARRPPWRRRCAGCRRTPARGCRARRPARCPCGPRSLVSRVSGGCGCGPRRAGARAGPADASGGARRHVLVWLRPRRPRPAAPSAGSPSAPSAAASSSAPRARCRPRPRPRRARPRGPRRRSAWVTLTTRVSASVTSVAPSGSSTAPAQDLRAGLEALDGDDDVLGDVGGQRPRAGAVCGRA